MEKKKKEEEERKLGWDAGHASLGRDQFHVS